MATDGDRDGQPSQNGDDRPPVWFLIIGALFVVALVVGIVLLFGGAPSEPFLRREP